MTSPVPPSNDPNQPTYVAPQPASKNNTLAIVVGVGIVAIVLVLVAGIFVLKSGQTTSTTATTALASSADPTSTSTSAATGGAGGAGGAGGQTGNNNGGQGGQGGNGGQNGGGQAPTTKGNAPVTTAKPSGPAPTITSFTTPENIDCHNNDNPMFSASWTTTNATKTTIAIDGPGLYKTYGPNGSDSLPFNCSSPHTFKLTAFSADGQSVSKTVTLQPRNVRPPQTPDTDS